MGNCEILKKRKIRASKRTDRKDLQIRRSQSRFKRAFGKMEEIYELNRIKAGYGTLSKAIQEKFWKEKGRNFKHYRHLFQKPANPFRRLSFFIAGLSKGFRAFYLEIFIHGRRKTGHYTSTNILDLPQAHSHLEYLFDQYPLSDRIYQFQKHM